MNIPEHFTLKEMTATGTGLLNSPGSCAQVQYLHMLALFLDGVRADFGRAVRVNSAFRTAAVNKAVGGSPASAHLKGLAADIAPWKRSDAADETLLSTLREKLGDIDQLIVYTADGKETGKLRWIHVGLADGTPRNQLIWKKG